MSIRRNAITNRLKGLYIGSYFPVAGGIGMYSVYNLWTGGFAYGWLGAALATLPVVMLVTMLLILKNRARTSDNFPLLLVAGFVGVALAGYGTYVAGESNIALLLAGIGLGTFIVYDFWYSRLGREPSAALREGSVLPEFEAQDQNGKMISSRSFAGKPALIMFYRGNWCPLCMAQVKEIAGRYQELAKMGVQVVLISPQPHKNTVKLAHKFSVPFTFLTDTGNKAADILDIAMANGLPTGMEVLGYDSDTVYPTVIATDAEGKILFVNQTDNYRVRPEPDTFIGFFERQTPQLAAE